MIKLFYVRVGETKSISVVMPIDDEIIDQTEQKMVTLFRLLDQTAGQKTLPLNP